MEGQEAVPPSGWYEAHSVTALLGNRDVSRSRETWGDPLADGTTAEAQSTGRSERSLFSPGLGTNRAHHHDWAVDS